MNINTNRRPQRIINSTSSIATDHNRETAHSENPVAQNAVGHHSQEKRGETTAPNKTVSTALTWIENPNQSVHECNLALNSKKHKENIPDLCVQIPACA